MKKVLITGSSRGIGASIARFLHNKEYEVILHGRTDSNALKEMQKELGARAITFDVSDTLESNKVLSNLIAQIGTLWGVVLNAGMTNDNTFLALEENDWKDVINTNLNSFYNVLKPLLMPMARAKKGRVVVISSISGITGNRGQTNYAASKAGLIGAAKSLSIELASRNICVNVVAPGLIQTDMIDNANLPLDEILKLIPAKRIGSADEVSPLVEFLLSEHSSYITRQVIGVNGGMA